MKATGPATSSAKAQYTIRWILRRDRAGAGKSVSSVIVRAASGRVTHTTIRIGRLEVLRFFLIGAATRLNGFTSGTCKGRIAGTLHTRGRHSHGHALRIRSDGQCRVIET